MRYRRLRPGTTGMRRAIGLAFLVATGCSPQEELKPDPGVSPFYPGPSAEAKTPGGSSPAGATADRAAGAAVAVDLEGPLRPEDVEKQLRIAMRAGERGDLARATALLDRILALEPANREAMLGRASIAMTQAKQATSPEERLTAIEKAGAMARALRRAYEKPNSRELELFSKVGYEEVKTNVKQGWIDRAIVLLKDIHSAGFDPFDAIDHDADLAPLRNAQGYKDLVSAIDAENLAKARELVNDLFAKTKTYTFAFDTKDLDDKPLSLDQYKGKVLLVDIWGTWCKPCRETIPGLIQLYHKHRRRGFDLIGLDYEQDATDPAKTREFVKQFVKESSMPYRIAMFDDAMREKVPNLQGYPTTLLIDRTGKVRIQLTGGGQEAIAIIDAALQILLSEPEPKAAPAPAAAPADTKDAAKPK